MLSSLISNSAAFQEVELTFPNLFGGFTISYFQGFELFGIKIYWYGVLITLGVILAYLYANHRAKEFGVGKERMFDVVFVALICGFLGARIYYCVFTTLDPNSSVKYDFVTTFTMIRDGGLAIYGGVIGAFLGGFVMSKIRKVHFRSMADLASLGFLIGQTIGRWGNFVNQEAFGAACGQDWVFGMTSVDIVARDHLAAGTLVHPCFLYESVWCLVGFIGLHFYSKKLRTFDGEIFLLYLAWYGLGRAWIEGLRTDSLMAGQFRISQVVAAICFVACTVMVIVFKILTEKKKIPMYVTTEAWTEQQAADLEAAEKQKNKKKEKLQAPSILADDAANVTLGDENEETEDDTAEDNSTDETSDSDDSVDGASSDENVEVTDSDKNANDSAHDASSDETGDTSESEPEDTPDESEDK